MKTILTQSCLLNRRHVLRGLGATIALPLLFLALAGAGVFAAEPRNIPFRPDPPPALDGNLDEWRSVPDAIELNRKEQVAWGGSAWKSPADLSVRIWLAWRGEGLYLVAEVTDDQLRQENRGPAIHKGDNVQLFLDLAPDTEAARDSFGAGQFQICFSPGNFKRTGDAFTDLPPEAHCYKPQGRAAADIRVVSQQSAQGWNLEALVPWSFLDVKQPAAGLPMRFEVAMSDTDGTEARQEKLMTSGTGKWAIRRGRLNEAALAGADGKVPATLRTTAVFDTLSLKVGEKQTVQFTAARPPAGKEVVLSLKARMDNPRVGGFASAALQLTFNGTPLDGPRLVNKPLQAKAADGRTYSLVMGRGFSAYYAPDFDAVEKSSYAMAGVKACEFELRVTDLVREGANELVIANAALPVVKHSLIAAEGRIAVGETGALVKPKAGPPTGPLETFQPAAAHKVAYRVKELPDARLEVELAGEQFTIESEFSTPDGKWVQGENKFFQHTRTVEQRDEAILIRDTFTNLTDDNLPLMQRHRAKTGGEVTKIWLAGLSPASLSGTAGAPQNPTSFGVTAKCGLGLLPLNDEFQVHVRNEAGGGVLGLADPLSVLPPRASYTAEWAIVPVARPDYFDFVNAVRRLRDANFTIQECFAFLRAHPTTEKWSDEQFVNFARFKSATMLCATILSSRHQGTGFQLINRDNFTRWAARVRRLLPGVKSSVYFSCFLDPVESSPEKFADSRMLRPDGSQADYGKPVDKLFFPTEQNAFGRAIARNVELIFEEIRAGGVWWDGSEQSSYPYHYGEPWDGCSADIDPRTHKIVRLKSSFTLITQPWRVAMAKRILAHGPLVGNGQPLTRTGMVVKFPHAVETGSLSHCSQAQIYSPIALGDHLTERSEIDAYRHMLAALDYGCLSYWYPDLQVIPTHETLTKYMYPFTPLELHEGCVIGQERILTNRSGLFGWGDDSPREVHVFDDTGREVPDFRAPTLVKNGATFTELRLAEGWSAAIVRSKQ
ncbi:MAG: hypothetical protein A2107_09725 [Verrucomicrobia bacterium GWF2_62_7]|nr:MAG: hypothetical protein A2107_09725 [Verrucomicrobia bacterium GWF2_62_7]